MELKPGDTLDDRYQLLSKLGEGGMGEVWKARDPRLGRDVAIKVSRTEFTARFEREALAMAAFSHENICQVHDVGRDYIVMELVEGTPPAGPLDPARAIRLGLGIAAALEAAHEKGIVHRDLKPGNILVTRTGVKLLDFGLAKLYGNSLDTDDDTATALTRHGQILGTLQYMAPEQLHGKEADVRTDIFAFGCVLYEMLGDTRAFAGSTPASLILSILECEPAPLRTTPALSHIVQTCLRKNPDERYQTVRELKRDLIQAAESEAPSVPGYDSAEQGRQAARAAGPGEAPSLPSSSAAARFLVTRHWKWAVPAVVCLLAVPGALWMANLPPFSRVPAQKKIAVLPFLNVGGAAETQALCDGIMEAVTSELTQLEQFHDSLWVVPSSEVRRERFSGAAGARRALGANLVISGSLQRDASHVHLTAYLVDTGTLRQLRSRTIEKPFAQFTDLQEEVVDEIANMLKLELGSQERGILVAEHPKAAGAYDLYLQAEGYLQRGNTADLDRAIDLFERAIGQDSNYVLAYAALGEAYWRKYRVTHDNHWAELAEKSCDRAVALNDHLAPVYVALGIVQAGKGDHEQAIQTFQRALKLDHINASAQSELGNSYLAEGRLEDAERVYKKAVELRPGDFTSLNGLGVYYYKRGRYQDAANIFRRTTQLVPDNSSGYTNLGAVYWMGGQYDEAAISYEKSLALRPTASAYSSLGTVYFFLDRCAEAAPLMEKAAGLQPNNDQVWGNLADVYGCSPDGRGKAAQAYQRALQLAEALLRVNPKDAEALGRVALYQARLGDKEKAMLTVKRALQLAPADRAVVWHAALTYELAGRREAALASVEAALKSGQAIQEVNHEPTLARLRQDPRYAQIMAGYSGHAR